MKFRLALANFLQAFPFCLVLIHGLFLRSGQHNEYQLAIVFSMGLYSALQIGGIWFISWIPRKIITEPFFWNFLRIAGGFIYLIDNSISIIIGTGLLGLAQALFYRFSRQMIGNYWKNKPSEMDHVYTIMALSLNISFLVLPVAGSELGKHFSTTILMSISVIFSIIGVALIERDKQFWQEIDPINIKETSQIIEKINDKLIVNPNRPDLFGKDISTNEEDGDGKKFREEFLENIKKYGESYTRYSYKKPDSKALQYKLSYCINRRQ